MFTTSRRTISSLLAPVALIALIGTTGVAKGDANIDNAEFCVDATHFRFTVNVSEPNIGDADHTAVGMVFRVGADAPVFGVPVVERIAVNFDLDTGAITLGPLVETFGAALDRWLNEDPITDFTLTSFGGGAYRIEGSVPNGTQPFVAGDTINQVVQRELNSHLGAQDAILSGVPIDACDNQIGQNVTFGVGVILGTGIIIEDGASIGDFTEIRDDVFIGENVFIGANSLLDIKTEVDDNAILGAGCMVKTVINYIFHPATVAKEAQVGAHCDLAGGTEVGRGAMIGEDFTTASQFIDEAHTDLRAVTIGKGATIGDSDFLDFGTEVSKGVVLGDNVTTFSGTCGITSECFPTRWVTFDQNAVVGDNVFLDVGTEVGRGVEIGDGVTTMSGECTATTDCFPTRWLQNSTIGDFSEFDSGTVVEQDASVGEYTMVGKDVVIEMDAKVGNFVTLGDGVVVPKGSEVPDGTVLP
jgi:UDP-3-O-[3-hydroxymyristoyl] glucosamine N-acyltransferase